MLVHEQTKVSKLWTVQKFESEAARLAGAKPYEVVEFEENVLLNEGIQLLEDLLIGEAGTPFNNANAYLGVGDSSTAADAAQTGLLAGANLLYQGMEAGYPQRSAQTITWRAVFADASANFAWNEVSLSNASGGNTGVNLNRRVPGNLGTKASGSWTLDLAITIT
ncbi:MAG: hypothetical protein KZQ94_10415 [Candidatus Thiodiazotropha sp. (ex Troendleina suluensis)]|nr:hypothetical protein [Candidatus Thiodiazotropha sp. (ex Troendleina suluensis)]